MAIFVMALLAISTSAMAETEHPLLPFYEAVTKTEIKGALGHLVKQEEIPTTLKDARAWRIAYISSDVNDRKTIATGLLISPTGKPPKDGRPVISWAHGTTGTAQNCGPSQVVNPAVSLNQYFIVGGNSYIDYGIPAVENFLKAGYIVVATDYQGLGGGGKHQYVLSATQGRDAINAIRAAGDMKSIGANKKALIYGWSQGGGATIAAASSVDYIRQKGTAFDDINMVGFVALSPPYLGTKDNAKNAKHGPSEPNLDNLVKTFTGNVFDFTHLSMTLWAVQATFPEKLKLTDIYTEEGARVIDSVMSNKCVHAASDTLSYTYGERYVSLLASEVINEKEWVDAILTGGVPNVRPIAPTIIYWGTKDTVVPPLMSKDYQEQMCKIGGDVARVQLAGEQTHFSTPAAAQPLYLKWIADRFAGLPTEDGCVAVN